MSDGIDWDKVLRGKDPPPEVDNETLWKQLRKIAKDKRYTRVTKIIVAGMILIFMVDMLLLYSQIGSPYGIILFLYVFPSTLIKMHHIYLIKKQNEAIQDE